MIGTNEKADRRPEEGRPEEDREGNLAVIRQGWKFSGEWTLFEVR
jgi:hypothetical protein